MTAENTGRRTPERLEREQLISAVQSRERFLEGILGSLEGFVTVDRDWRYTFVNDAAATMAGRSAHDLLGQDMWEVALVPMGDEASGRLRRAMAERVSVEYELWDPRRGTYHGKAYPVADEGLAIYIRDVSERVRADEARAATEQRYRELVQSVNSAILRWTGDGALTFFNEYAEQLFGWRADEVLGRHVDFLLPESEPGGSDLSHLAEEIVAHPELYESHLNENVRKDGGRLWMAWTNQVLLDEQGEVREVLAVGNDVSELVRAQAALRESEERFRALADQSPFLIWVSDAEGTVEFVNRTCLEFFGVDEGAVEGAGWTPLVHPDDVDRYVGEFMAATRERRPFIGEARVLSASGEWRWIDSHGAPWFSASGQFLGMVGSSPDITDRKRAEAQRNFLLTLSDALGPLPDPGEVQRTACVLLGEHLAADGVHYGEFHDDAGFVIVPPDYRREGLRSLAGRHELADFGETPKMLRKGRTVVVSDIETSPLFSEAVRETYRALEIRAFVAAPLVRGGKLVWTLSVVSSSLREWTPDEVELVEEVGDRTWAALERSSAEAALRESEAEKAAQQERSRLARDLHDSVTQALFAATMKAEALTLAGDAHPLRIAETIEEVRRLSRGALAQMRALLLELRADPLEDVPMPQLLRHLVEAVESRTSTDVRLTIRGGGCLSPALHVTVYRIVQEALNNVARHAGATHAWVVLELHQEGPRLEIGDDGRGFDPALVGAAHLGLRSMRERAAEAGAEYRLETGPDRGTRITVDWRQEGEPRD